MEDWLIPIRWIHVVSASAWFGEVVVINLILIPALSAQDAGGRRDFLAGVFPRVFRLASFLSATTVISGALLVYLLTAGDLGMLTAGRWGVSILVGGTMGLALTLFHFFMEDKLARRIGIGCPDTTDAVLNDVHAKLKVVPRVGLMVIGTIFFLMMFAVRGV